MCVFSFGIGKEEEVNKTEDMYVRVQSAKGGKGVWRKGFRMDLGKLFGREIK